MGLIIHSIYIDTHAVQSVRSIGSADNTVHLDATFIEDTPYAGAMFSLFWPNQSSHVYAAVNKDVFLGGFGLKLEGVYGGPATVRVYNLNETGKLTPGDMPTLTVPAFVNGDSESVIIIIQLNMWAIFRGGLCKIGAFRT